VGDGAEKWAKKHGIEVSDDPELLVTPDTRAAFEKYSKIISEGKQSTEIQSQGNRIFYSFT
jgi:hypothetical protein